MPLKISVKRSSLIHSLYFQLLGSFLGSIFMVVTWYRRQILPCFPRAGFKMVKPLSITVMALLFSMSVFGATVGKVEFPDTIQQQGGPQLKLNGLGIRHKWFVKVYAAGLYLSELTHQADAILQSNQARQVRMHFLYKKVSKEKLLGTLEQGFTDNLTSEELQALSAEITQLRSLFKTVRKGDEVILDYHPDSGTDIVFNGESQGTIPGFEFQQAILRVWLGDRPADKKLKQRLLGRDQ